MARSGKHQRFRKLGHMPAAFVDDPADDRGLRQKGIWQDGAGLFECPVCFCAVTNPGRHQLRCKPDDA